MYYVYIENEKINGIGQYPCTTAKTVEITKEIFDQIEKYIWDGTQIILDPDYDEKQEQKRKQERNLEIDSKIKELREMSIEDIMNNNKENIKIYKDIIYSLELSRP